MEDNDYTPPPYDYVAGVPISAAGGAAKERDYRANPTNPPPAPAPAKNLRR